VFMTGAAAACVWVVHGRRPRIVPLSVMAVCLLLSACDRRPERRSVLIDGSSAGTDICFLVRGKAEVWPTRGRDYAVTRAWRLFAAYGADTAEVCGVFPRDTTVCGLMLAGEGSGGDVSPEVLVVDGRFRGSLSEIIGTVRPRLVVLGADIDARRHLRYVHEADSIGAEVHDLRRKAFFRPID
ncbi:MAG: hypothetical protein K2J38_00140, partial [Muribaculaceae bacterium]|nr:hypothetical protein [Muribaculaceae bacterium]